MASWSKDVSYSLRSLAKQPAFTLIAVITLTAGIGATTTIFSVVNAVLLRPLPWVESERLVWIVETSPLNDIDEEVASAPNFYDWKAQNSVFSDMVAFGRFRPVLTGSGEPAQIPGGYATPGLFPLLGAQPALGRTFAAGEGAPGADPVVLLSDGLWRRRYGADPNILGQTITLNGTARTVVGVMPPGYRHPDLNGEAASQLWIPVEFDPTTMNRRSDFLRVIARLKPGVDLERARGDMETIAARLEQDYPDTNLGWSVKLIPLQERFSRDISRSLWVLLAAVGFLLAIACANVANLQLTRASGRRKEIAIRVALGAGRWPLVRQFLVESSIVALIGGGLGVLVAVWGIDALLSLRPAELPVFNDVALDGRVLAFTLAVSLLTGLGFGLAPALQASSPDVRDAIQDGGRGTGDGGSGGRRLRNVLVVSEVALALLMLVGAGLMIRSLWKMLDADPGVDVRGVLIAGLRLPAASYEGNPEITAFYRELVERVSAQPGVRDAAVSTDIPLTGASNFRSFNVEGRTMGPQDPSPDSILTTTTPGYFRVMGIDLLRGRLLEATDREDAPAVAVINEAMARRYWPDGEPVGERINFSGSPEGWIEVVGIVSDTRDESLDAEPYPQTYVSLSQGPLRSMRLVLRTDIDPMAAVAGVRAAVRELDPDLPVAGVQTMEDVFAASLAQRRFSMILLSVFAGVALLLAAVGIYGVIAYSVTRRTHEIGIRMALGARLPDVRAMIIGHGMTLAAAGIAIGIGAGLILTRLMASLVYEVSTADPLTFAGIAMLLGGVALLACWLPARRATRVDPMIALRYE